MLTKILFAVISLIALTFNTYALDLSTYGIENDLFAGTDYYYTNGFFYRSHSKESNDSWIYFPVNFSDDSVNSFEFVQQIHTPFATRKKNRPLEDAPYVGKLYLNLISNYQSKYVSSKYEFTLGIVGPNSGSKFVQNFFHQILPASKVEGWDEQVKNDYLLNYSIYYAIALIKLDGFAMHFLNNYHGGTNYTGSSAGFSITFADKANMYHDYIRLKNIELSKFLFRIGFQKDYMIYDSSLMGGVNNKQENALAYHQLEKLIDHGSVEIQYTWARLTLKLRHDILTNRIIENSKSHEYTGIYFIYRE